MDAATPDRRIGAVAVRRWWKCSGSAGLPFLCLFGVQVRCWPARNSRRVLCRVLVGRPHVLLAGFVVGREGQRAGEDENVDAGV
jgi:hypothetical protein